MSVPGQIRSASEPATSDQRPTRPARPAVLVLAELTMTCGQFARGATQRWRSMLATDRIGPVPREQEVDLEAELGWANADRPQQLIRNDVTVGGARAPVGS